MDRFGKYVILDKLGVGGMARVFRARLFGPHGFEKTLALKIIDPERSGEREFVDLFVREATLAARLDHDNIVRILDFDQVEGVYYIAMEYVDGSDLRKLLNLSREAGAPFRVSEAVTVAYEVCKGLAYAHGEVGSRPVSVIHSDISPTNILVARTGAVKITDFGVAILAGATGHTTPGVIRGKFNYMSPEQSRAEPLDKRTDIFSLGCVLWELLVGEKLFEADTDAEVIEKVRGAEIRPPSFLNPTVPEELDALVLHALVRDREKRTITASALVNGLHQVMSRLDPAEEAAPSVILERLTDRLLPSREATTTVAASLIQDQRPSAPVSLPPGFGTKEITVLDRPMAGGMSPPATISPETPLELDLLAAGARAQQAGKSASSVPGPPVILRVVPDLEPESPPGTPSVSLAPPAEQPGSPAGPQAPADLTPAPPAASHAPGSPPEPLPLPSPAPAPSRRSRRLFVAFWAMVLVALGVSVGVVWSRISGGADRSSPPDGGFPALQESFFSTLKAGLSPPEVSKPVLSSAVQPADPESSPPAPAAPEPSIGWLYLKSMPTAEVYLGEKKIGDTPMKNARLPAGKHWLRLVNEALGLEKTVLVEILPGKHIKKAVDIRK